MSIWTPARLGRVSVPKWLSSGLALKAGRRLNAYARWYDGVDRLLTACERGLERSEGGSGSGSGSDFARALARYGLEGARRQQEGIREGLLAARGLVETRRVGLRRLKGTFVELGGELADWSARAERILRRVFGTPGEPGSGLASGGDCASILASIERPPWHRTWRLEEKDGEDEGSEGDRAAGAVNGRGRGSGNGKGVGGGWRGASGAGWSERAFGTTFAGEAGGAAASASASASASAGVVGSRARPVPVPVPVPNPVAGASASATSSSVGDSGSAGVPELTRSEAETVGRFVSLVYSVYLALNGSGALKVAGGGGVAIPIPIPIPGAGGGGAFGAGVAGIRVDTGAFGDSGGGGDSPVSGGESASGVPSEGLADRAIDELCGGGGGDGGVSTGSGAVDRGDGGV